MTLLVAGTVLLPAVVLDKDGDRFLLQMRRQNKDADLLLRLSSDLAHHPRLRLHTPPWVWRKQTLAAAVKGGGGFRP
jgi:hypothetical protein